jgi:3'-phosphoadenosine 5'-phosphosulfate sulfotransferase (PAPS reductase)/FAD synthetase
MIPKAIRQLIEREALFVVNHSGGKDSQAMYLHLRSFVPAHLIVIVHADLGEVEWGGAVEHIERTTHGEPIHVCRNENRTLLQMIEQRGKFPSPQIRQCTSDLKRGPIERTIRAIVAKRRARGERGGNLVVNCMGMRAEESSSRAKLKTLKLSKGNSVAGREWYDWLPIHGWSVGDVFAAIKAAGQEPHPVYAKGMSRFSCCFCVMASEHDLTTAAGLNPRLYARYVGLERSTGQVMLMPKNGVRRTLEDVTGIKADMSLLEAA